MKIRPKWRFVLLLTLIFSFPTNIYAQSLVLIGEFFSNDTLLLVYEDKNNKQVTRSFSVPEHLRSRIAHSENTALEAKKILTAYYTLTNDQKSLNGIQNKTDETGTIVPTVQADFNKNFQKDLDEVNAFVKEELKREGAKEEYIDPIVVETVDAAPLTEDDNQEENKKESDKKEDKKESDKKTTSFVTIMGAIVLFALIGGSLYVISKRR